MVYVALKLVENLVSVLKKRSVKEIYLIIGILMPRCQVDYILSCHLYTHLLKENWMDIDLWTIRMRSTK